jgi:hypothetical protein
MGRFNTRCSRAGQREIGFEVDSVIPEHSAQHVVAMVEGLVNGGAVISDGQTIQLGWMILQVVSQADGSLELHEPDGLVIPIRFKPNITLAVSHMMWQLWHADSYAIPRDTLDIPSILTSAIVCSAYSGSDGLLLTRAEKSDEMDSGWFIGCTDPLHDHNDVANLKRESLYQTFIHRPGIAPWMTFPTGSSVLLKPDQGSPIVCFGDVECTLIEGSFVDVSLARRGKSVS